MSAIDNSRRSWVDVSPAEVFSRQGSLERRRGSSFLRTSSYSSQIALLSQQLDASFEDSSNSDFDDTESSLSLPSDGSSLRSSTLAKISFSKRSDYDAVIAFEERYKECKFRSELNSTSMDDKSTVERRFVDEQKVKSPPSVKRLSGIPSNNRFHRSNNSTMKYIPPATTIKSVSEHDGICHLGVDEPVDTTHGNSNWSSYADLEPANSSNVDNGRSSPVLISQTRLIACETNSTDKADISRLDFGIVVAESCEQNGPPLSCDGTSSTPFSIDKEQLLAEIMISEQCDQPSPNDVTNGLNAPVMEEKSSNLFVPSLLLNKTDNGSHNDDSTSCLGNPLPSDIDTEKPLTDPHIDQQCDQPPELEVANCISEYEIKEQNDVILIPSLALTEPRIDQQCDQPPELEVENCISEYEIKKQNDDMLIPSLLMNETGNCPNNDDSASCHNSSLPNTNSIDTEKPLTEPRIDQQCDQPPELEVANCISEYEIKEQNDNILIPSLVINETDNCPNNDDSTSYHSTSLPTPKSVETEKPLTGPHIDQQCDQPPELEVANSISESEIKEQNDEILIPSLLMNETDNFSHNDDSDSYCSNSLPTPNSIETEKPLTESRITEPHVDQQCDQPSLQGITTICLSESEKIGQNDTTLSSLDETAKATNANIDSNTTEPVTEPLAATLFVGDDPQMLMMKSEMAETAMSVSGEEPSFVMALNRPCIPSAKNDLSDKSFVSVLESKKPFTTSSSGEIPFSEGSRAFQKTISMLDQTSLPGPGQMHGMDFLIDNDGVSQTQHRKTAMNDKLTAVAVQAAPSPYWRLDADVSPARLGDATKRYPSAHSRERHSKSLPSITPITRKKSIRVNSSADALKHQQQRPNQKVFFMPPGGTSASKSRFHVVQCKNLTSGLTYLSNGKKHQQTPLQGIVRGHGSSNLPKSLCVRSVDYPRSTSSGSIVRVQNEETRRLL